MTRPARTPPTAPPGLLRCAIYTRTSTTIGGDESLSSLDAQRDVGVRYVEGRHAQGWRVLATQYDDGGFTGANLERPAFQRLLADVRARKLDVVVVYKVDRLSRSLLDFAQVMAVFDEHDVAFVSVTQNFLTAEAIGRLTLNLLITFAEFEREMIAERTRDKIAASRRRGHWTGGIVPYGYRSVNRKLVIEPTEAEVVRLAYATYLASGSVRAVARALDARQPRRCRDGRTRPWRPNDVRFLLDTPVYAGLTRAGDALVDGEHEAIIPRATFEQARDARVPRSTPRPADDSYVLRGLAFCDACGASLAPATTRRGRRTFRYYRCRHRDRHGKDTCTLTPVQADQLEGALLGEIRARVTTRGVQELVVAELQAELAVEAAELADLLATSPSTRVSEVAPPEFNTLQQRAVEVNQRLADLAWVPAALGQFDALWAVYQPGERARLIEAVVAQVRVQPDHTAQLTWQPWFEKANGR